MNSIPKEKPTIYCDNQACIRLAKEGRSKRAKHIEIKFLHVKENLEKGMFTLDYIGTDEMIADMMTKALGQPKLEKFRSAVCITDRYSQPIEGGCWVLKACAISWLYQLRTESFPRYSNQSYPFSLNSETKKINTCSVKDIRKTFFGTFHVPVKDTLLANWDHFCCLFELMSMKRIKNCEFFGKYLQRGSRNSPEMLFWRLILAILHRLWMGQILELPMGKKTEKQQQRNLMSREDQHPQFLLLKVTFKWCLSRTGSARSLDSITVAANLFLCCWNFPCQGMVTSNLCSARTIRTARDIGAHSWCSKPGEPSN